MKIYDIIKKISKLNYDFDVVVNRGEYFLFFRDPYNLINLINFSLFFKDDANIPQKQIESIII